MEEALRAQVVQGELTSRTCWPEWWININLKNAERDIYSVLTYGFLMAHELYIEPAPVCLCDFTVEN